MQYLGKLTGSFNYRVLLKWIIVLPIFIFLGKMVWENWSQIKEASFSFRFLPLFLSTLLFALSYFIQIWAWYLITLKLNIALPWNETVRNWFTSQLGKYLPGKVWIFLSRFYLYESKGKSKKAITLALYFETITMVMAAGLLSFISLFSSWKDHSSYLGISTPWLILLSIGAFLFLHPAVLQKIINSILAFFKRDPISISLSYLNILWILGICVLCWMIGGIGFYLFIDSVYPISPQQVLFLIGALTISSTLGLLALFAPSGLGVREGALVYLLSSIMPSSVAVILSILTRLWMTLIEIGLIGMVYSIGRFQKGIGHRNPNAQTE